MRTGIKKINGFTLLEVLISLAIVSAVLMTVIYTVNYYLSLIQRHETTTVATMLAREKIHTVSAQQRDKKGNFPEPYQDYSYEITVDHSLFEKVNIVKLYVMKDGEKVELSKFIKVNK